MNTQIIAIANQKGGVGKTTTCANLGIGLAQAGKKVLLIDGDPQGSLTISLGHPQPDKLPFTLSDAMGRILMDEPLRPGEGILHHPEGVDLMPADIQLSGMEVSLVNAMSRETILRQYLDTLKGQYSHKIDCIIVKDFSRFGRNSIETGYFIERVFPLFHTRFISINDDFDSDQHKGDTGGMDVAFKYLISEYYSRDMSIKTKSAKYAKMQRGEYQSKVCPYGYRKSADGRMEPNPETAAVVQLIFQLAATGIGAAAVTRELFKRGIPTPGEYKAAHGQKYHDVSRSRSRWSGATVLRILEDERYIGSYVIGRRAVIEVGGTRSRRKDRDKWFIIPDHHPAIVDKELFEKVQAVQRRFSLPTKKTREYPLKGKVYCGCCDHALSRIAQKKPFYMCRHSTADVNSRCRDVRADAAGLEEAVLLTLKKQLEVLLPVHEDGTIHLEATAAKCSEYEKQLKALKDQKQALFERYLLGQIELDTYKSEKAVYDAEILKVKNAYAAVTAQAKLKREEQARQSSRQEIVHSIAAADVLTSELTDLLIEKVYVFPDNRIEIVYKVHDLFE